MKNEENQDLKFSQWAFGFFLIAILGFISIPSWTRQREEERVLNAKRHAEVLGYQVFEIYRESVRKIVPLAASGSRSPASLKTGIEGDESLRERGQIGSDPWGQPYRYKILNTASPELKVQLWSSGPNRKFETKDEVGIAADIYAGDDVGIVLSLDSRPSE